MNFEQLKYKIYKEYEKIEDVTSSTIIGKKSILVSISMLFYSFIIVGSSVQTTIPLLILLREIVKFISIFFGIYIYYLNFYMNHLQLKLNRKLIGYIALVFNIISLLYFIFVSFVYISEIPNNLG